MGEPSLYGRCFALPGHYLRPHQRHGGFGRLNVVLLVGAPRATEIELTSNTKNAKKTHPCQQNKLICHPNRARSGEQINFGRENMCINSKKIRLFEKRLSLYRRTILLIAFFSSKINILVKNLCVIIIIKIQSIILIAGLEPFLNSKISRFSILSLSYVNLSF